MQQQLAEEAAAAERRAGGGGGHSSDGEAGGDFFTDNLSRASREGDHNDFYLGIAIGTHRAPRARERDAALCFLLLLHRRAWARMPRRMNRV